MDKTSEEGLAARDILQKNQRKLNFKKIIEEGTLEKTRKMFEEVFGQVNGNILEKFPVSIEKYNFQGTNLVDIRPKKELNKKKIMIHVHGGAFALFSAEEQYGVSIPLVNELNIRVLAINYTRAPEHKYGEIVKEIEKIVHKVIADGYCPDDITLLGESAGGALALSTAYNLLTKSTPAIKLGALVVLSPWVDWSCRDESFTSAKTEDVILCKENNLDVFATLVIEPQYTVDNYPFYPISLEYPKDFPPVLIQYGTCEILRDQIRALYSNLLKRGVDTEINCFVGMWHVFQGSHTDLPESVVARKAIKEFLYKRLRI